MIKNKLKKILNLSNIFIKDSYQDMNLIDYKRKKINKKSIYFWMLLILFFALFFISQEIIKFLKPRGLSEIFLNIYFLLISILIMFQTVLLCTNIFYFSKDIENILPLPITPLELLIAKYITLLTKIYISEIVFGIIPIIIYGIYNNSNLLFYLYTIIILVIFPIFFTLLISIIMMFFMKILKYIKNKDLLQIIITISLIIFMFILQYKILGTIIVNKEIEEIEQNQILEKILEFNNKVKDANNYLIIINPSIKCLIKPNFASIIEIIRIFSIDFFAFLLFIFIGKITYLKDILKNTTFLINKKNKQINLNRKTKKNIKVQAYIKTEFKTLFRNPMYFMQCVFPVLILIITFVVTSIIIRPRIEMLFSNEEFLKQIGNLSFNITAVYIILGIMQILFMMSPAALTGFSRLGKNANYIKYIPVSYYKQFIYKGIPQIFINIFSIFTVLFLVNFFIPNIELKYNFYIFILGFLLNIINTYIMLIIDLKNPKLQWDTEYALLKQNNNKIFQYIFTVFIFLTLIYFNSIFEKLNMDISIFHTGIIFLIIIIIINIFVKTKQKKLFKKII